MCTKPREWYALFLLTFFYSYLMLTIRGKKNEHSRSYYCSFCRSVSGIRTILYD